MLEYLGLKGHSFVGLGQSAVYWYSIFGENQWHSDHGNSEFFTEFLINLLCLHFDFGGVAAFVHDEREEFVISHLIMQFSKEE